MVTNRNISWFDSNISQRWTRLSVSLSMRYKSPKTAGLISPIFWMRPLEACVMGCLPQWRWVLVKVDQCVKLIKQANIIWHFASRGNAGAGQRLALADFQALLDAKVRIYMIGWWLADKYSGNPLKLLVPNYLQLSPEASLQKRHNQRITSSKAVLQAVSELMLVWLSTICDICLSLHTRLSTQSTWWRQGMWSSLLIVFRTVNELL